MLLGALWRRSTKGKQESRGTEAEEGVRSRAVSIPQENLTINTSIRLFLKLDFRKLGDTQSVRWARNTRSSILIMSRPPSADSRQPLAESCLLIADG